MNARSALPDTTPPAAPRFDRKFIEEHRLIERYLDNKLPAKGARDLENFCRLNPDYLDELQLPVRAQSTLKLLEASGRPQDLSEPTIPWWKSVYVPIGMGVLAFVSLVAFWALFSKYSLLRSQLDDTRVRLDQGSLVQPATESDLHVAPDRAPGIDKARVAVSHTAPQLIDLHIDMNATKSTQFRMLVDKKDQGRALILNNLLKDSNGELRLTINTTGLAVGTYNVRIEALPTRGAASPIPEAWLILDVR